ncbi:hypothetical protein ACFT7S_25980 [Streptomyces sp. NPDC057136]|uniref:hypothetical protein n=1 Tax=Streptomyces sp. NPDC057136 TaxID=3346029 RepID=UPI00363DB697
MTTAVARPADGPRPARGTGGRRALHVVLFLGALLALGLLFGGEAHATPRLAPEPPDAGSAVTAEADTTADRVTERAEESAPTAARRVRDTNPEAPERARGAAVETVRGSVTRPVRDAVTQSAQDTVQDTVEDTVQGLTGVLGSVSGALPPVPPLPNQMPSAPSVPLVPLLPGPTDAPPAVPSDGSADSAHPGTAPRAAADTISCGSYAPPAGPVVAGDGTDRAAAPEFRQGHGRSPVDPCGGTGRTPAAETHTPRSGDQQAAPVAHGPSFGLTRGVGLPATAAPVRDRSGQILEFPG